MASGVLLLSWKSPAILAKEFRLGSRMTVYRHAHALGLFEKRRRNLRTVLERIVERVDEVEVNAAAIISAVQALAKINIRGQWIERTEHLDLNELFERMSQQQDRTPFASLRVPTTSRGSSRHLALLHSRIQSR
jgi:hypothetical protein